MTAPTVKRVADEPSHHGPEWQHKAWCASRTWSYGGRPACSCGAAGRVRDAVERFASDWFPVFLVIAITLLVLAALTVARITR